MICFLPIGSKPFIQSKIEQSKHKQKYQDLTIPVFLLFVFRLFTHSFFFLKDSHNLFFSLLPKQRKGKIGKENESKKHHIYKENSNPRPLQPKLSLSLFSPFCEANSNSEAMKSRKKEQRTRQENLNLKI